MQAFFFLVPYFEPLFQGGSVKSVFPSLNFVDPDVPKNAMIFHTFRNGGTGTCLICSMKILRMLGRVFSLLTFKRMFRTRFVATKFG